MCEWSLPPHLKFHVSLMLPGLSFIIHCSINLCSSHQVWQMWHYWHFLIPLLQTAETGGYFLMEVVHFAHLLWLLMHFSAESKTAALLWTVSYKNSTKSHSWKIIFYRCSRLGRCCLVNSQEYIFHFTDQKHNNKQSVGHPVPRCWNSEQHWRQTDVLA